MATIVEYYLCGASIVFITIMAYPSSMIIPLTCSNSSSYCARFFRVCEILSVNWWHRWLNIPSNEIFRYGQRLWGKMIFFFALHLHLFTFGTPKDTGATFAYARFPLAAPQWCGKFNGKVVLIWIEKKHHWWMPGLHEFRRIFRRKRIFSRITLDVSGHPSTASLPL